MRALPPVCLGLYHRESGGNSLDGSEDDDEDTPSSSRYTGLESDTDSFSETEEEMHVRLSEESARTLKREREGQLAKAGNGKKWRNVVRQDSPIHSRPLSKPQVKMFLAGTLKARSHRTNPFLRKISFQVFPNRLSLEINHLAWILYGYVYHIRYIATPCRVLDRFITSLVNRIDLSTMGNPYKVKEAWAKLYKLFPRSGFPCEAGLPFLY